MNYLPNRSYKPVGGPAHREVEGKIKLMQEHEIWEEVYLINQGGQGKMENTGRTIWLEIPTEENTNG